MGVLYAARLDRGAEAALHLTFTGASVLVGVALAIRFGTLWSPGRVVRPQPRFHQETGLTEVWRSSAPGQSSKLGRMSASSKAAQRPKIAPKWLMATLCKMAKNCLSRHHPGLTA